MAAAECLSDLMLAANDSAAKGNKAFSAALEAAKRLECFANYCEPELDDVVVYLFAAAE